MGMANKQNCGGLAGYSEAITNKRRMVSLNRRTEERSVAEIRSAQELRSVSKGTTEEVHENRHKTVDVKFTTLDAASEYIQERWQGVDYINTTRSFHTDFAVYTLIGFSLEDIGQFVEEPYKNWCCYSFNHPIKALADC